MGDPAMELTQSQLQQIADYVKSQIPDWVYKSEPPNRDLQERIIRIEATLKEQNAQFRIFQQELKAQREVMAARFEAVDKRFEAVDKRFESVDQRFGSLQWMWGGGVVLITLLMSLYQFID